MSPSTYPLILVAITRNGEFMSICGLHGRAIFDPLNDTVEAAFSTCDRCGLQYRHDDLVWQYDWRGNNMQNLMILVCKRTCVDEPFEFNRPIILPPDPMPILDARPGFYAAEEGPALAPNFEAQLIDELG